MCGRQKYVPHVDFYNDTKDCGRSAICVKIEESEQCIDVASIMCAMEQYMCV